ncbi:sucrase ferredoxin domain-containing protein [Ophiostoma piceae UAMH 11346]|uniref:Defect at low temperature protein 1 n=1 Tax=Ophiostoma piceae (strain UAMH 11346) TaxID=1262450 RepID=S3D2N0_OPHP1|nr:sucrase ferredoxin domain-containing protein [Ophiostoma piceae UAMH 11346]
MASSLRLFFRVVYASIYTFLHILVVALLLVTPGDIINQSRQRHDIVPIIIVSVAYVAAIITVAFVFFLRLFLNRAVLNSIPKSWIPIGKGDVRKHVRKMIAAGLSRSAAIAFVSRPRIVSDELFEDMCPMLSAGARGAEGALMSGGMPNKTLGKGAQRASAEKEGEEYESEKNNRAEIDNEKEINDAQNPSAPESISASPGSNKKAVRFKRVETVEKEKELGINLPPCLAVWGEIEHPGWAPPNQPVLGSRERGARSASGSSGGGDGPGPADLGAAVVAAGALDGEDLTLQYSTVLAELPHLIEAKALTLAPPQLDVEAVALLHRPIYMGLREYLAHLAELGVIDFTASGGSHGDNRPLGDVLPSFVATYEYARFSTQMLRHEQFRQLMHDLATILRRMTPLDPNLLLDDGGSDDDGDSYSAYEKAGSYMYSEGDSRPFYSGYSGYSGHSQDSTQSDDDDGVDGIDDVAARSSPTTPTRSRSRSYQKQQQRVPLPHILARAASHSSSAARSQSSASRASTASGSPGRRGGSRLPQNEDEDVDESDGTSRRRRVPRSGALLQPRARPRARDMRRVPSHASSSANSFAQSRNPYTVSSQPSSSSLRSAMSAAPSVAPSTASARSASTASDGGSVIIRLADRNEQSQGLPYVLMLPN